MTISTELFKSILAMDAYNRGYNQGLNVSGSDLGLASLGLFSDTGLSSSEVAASFFAQAYTLADGSTVISYRGSDGLAPTWLGGEVPTDVDGRLRGHDVGAA